MWNFFKKKTSPTPKFVEQKEKIDKLRKQLRELSKGKNLSPGDKTMRATAILLSYIEPKKLLANQDISVEECEKLEKEWKDMFREFNINMTDLGNNTSFTDIDAL